MKFNFKIQPYQTDAVDAVVIVSPPTSTRFSKPIALTR